ncbi:hypothetical protein GOBAR_DD05067 [Gossypium barbadense]|nr:hypothetical protein GOBAR_DD05067 [Gossypium barbadense]
MVVYWYLLKLTLLFFISTFLFQTIPDLCWELAQLQDTYILQGDYDLKVMRQEFYISRQKAFINHLINHLARHQLLKIACQLEKKNMLGAYSLLKVIESELQAYLSATKGRVGRCLALIQAASEVQEQGAVDDRDTFLHGVRDLLSIHSNAQAGLSTYVSAPGIVQQISGLHSDLMALQSDLENSLPEDRNRCINELCTLIQSLQQLLFASSTTAQPILTPRPLMKELDEMEKINAKLSAAVEEVTLEHCKKNEVIGVIKAVFLMDEFLHITSYDYNHFSVPIPIYSRTYNYFEIVKHHSQEVGLQRRVFVDFFCNPERLRSQMATRHRDSVLSCTVADSVLTFELPLFLPDLLDTLFFNRFRVGVRGKTPHLLTLNARRSCLDRKTAREMHSVSNRKNPNYLTHFNCLVRLNEAGEDGLGMTLKVEYAEEQVKKAQ